SDPAMCHPAPKADVLRSSQQTRPQLSRPLQCGENALGPIAPRYDVARKLGTPESNDRRRAATNGEAPGHYFKQLLSPHLRRRRPVDAAWTGTPAPPRG